MHDEANIVCFSKEKNKHFYYLLILSYDNIHPSIDHKTIKTYKNFKINTLIKKEERLTSEIQTGG